MSSPGRPAEPAEGGLDVPALLAREGVPGCSVALLDAGRVMERRAYGVGAGAAGDRELTTGSLLQACSISKMVSVFGALRLVAEGRLSLDAPVGDRLRRWQVPANGPWQPRVTLRQLASHTAGLGPAGFAGYPRDAALPSLEQVLTGVAPATSPGVRADIVPGVQFRYAGGGTTVLQLLVEEATGAPVAEALRELVLDPLGMADSTFEQPLPSRWEHRVARGHLAGGTPVPGGWHVHPEQCAAGLWTTPSDLLAFARGVQDALDPAVDALLPTAYAEEMVRPVVPTGTASGGADHVGLGTFLHLRDGSATWFEHSGSNVGYRCLLAASVRSGQGAAVMTNSDAGWPVVQRVVAAVAATHGWQDIETAVPDEGPRADLRTWAGSYRTGPGAVVALTHATHHGLLLTVDDQPPLELTLAEAGVLTTEDVDLVVRRGAEGSIVLVQAGRETRAART